MSNFNLLLKVNGAFLPLYTTLTTQYQMVMSSYFLSVVHVLVKAMAALRMGPKWFSFFPPQLFFESTSRNKTLKGGTQYVYYTTTHTTFTFIVGRVLIAGHVVTEYGTYVASSLNPEVEGFRTEGGCHVVLVMLLLTV